MSTALQVHEAETVPAVVRSDVDYGGLLALAKELVPTGFLPDHIKTPGQAVAIILTGRELGMQPMRALRSLTMVKGKVTENADSQLARFKADGGRAKWITLDETQAVLWMRMRNGDETTSSFTIEDAKRAGLVSAGGMYTKYPKPMLRSRAITQGLKELGWEGGVGAYDPEELAVVVPESAASTRPAHITEDGEDTSEQATHAPLKLARDKVMPMGHSRGTKLGDLEDKDLQSAAAWCREKGKFADLVEAIEEVLAERLEAKEREQTKLDLGDKQAGAGAPQESPAGNVVVPASPASGPAAAPTFDMRKPLAKWSAAQLQAYANQLLATEPALQSVKHDYLPLMNGLLSHEAMVGKIETLQKMIAESTKVAGAKMVDDSDLPF